MAEKGQWRRCSACKDPIALGAKYWTCNVSTCNRKRTGLVFCSVTCWDVHLPGANHREAWAVEQKAPLRAEGEPSEPGGRRDETGRRRIVRGESSTKAGREAPPEILIVASRLNSTDNASNNPSEVFMPCRSLT